MLIKYKNSEIRLGKVGTCVTTFCAAYGAGIVMQEVARTVVDLTKKS